MEVTIKTIECVNSRGVKMDKNRKIILATIIVIFAIVIGSIIIVSVNNDTQIETDDFTATVPWSDVQIIKTGVGAYEIHDNENDEVLAGITVAESSSWVDWRLINQNIIKNLGGTFLQEDSVGDIYKVPTSDAGPAYFVSKYDSNTNKGITVMCLNDLDGAKQIMESIHLK